MSLRPRQSLARAALLNLLAEGVLIVGTIVTAPILVRLMGPEEYGLLAFLTVLMVQLNILQFGIAPALTRRVAESGVAEPGGAHSVLAYATVLLAVVTALLTLLASLASLPYLFGDALTLSATAAHRAAATVPLAAVVLCVQPALGVCSGFLLGVEWLHGLAVLRLTHGLVRFAASIYAVTTNGGLPGVLTAYLVTDVASGLLMVWMILHHVVRQPAWQAVIDQIRAIARLGIPFAAATALAAVLVDAEKLGIALVRSVADLTYYSIPYNTFVRITILASSLAAILPARIAAEVAAGDVVAATGLARQAMRIVTSAVACIAILVTALAPEVLRLWLGPSFADRSTLVTRILMTAFVANVTAHVPVAVIRACGNPATLMRLYALEIPLHLILVYVLVDLLGIVGAALAWGLRVALDAIIQRKLAERALRTAFGDAGAVLGPVVAVMLFAYVVELTALSTPIRALLAGSVAITLVRATLRTEDLQVITRAFRLRRA